MKKITILIYLIFCVVVSVFCQHGVICNLSYIAGTEDLYSKASNWISKKVKDDQYDKIKIFVSYKFIGNKKFYYFHSNYIPAFADYPTKILCEWNSFEGSMTMIVLNITRNRFEVIGETRNIEYIIDDKLLSDFNFDSFDFANSNKIKLASTGNTIEEMLDKIGFSDFGSTVEEKLMHYSEYKKTNSSHNIIKNIVEDYKKSNSKSLVLSYKKEIVKSKQNALSTLGYSIPEVNGEVDEVTSATMKQFIEDNEINFNQNIRYAFFNDFIEDKLGYEVRNLLEQFRYLGFSEKNFAGDLDILKNTIIDFQKTYDLPQSSKLDEITKRKMHEVQIHNKENLFALGLIEELEVSGQRIYETILDFGKSNGKTDFKEAIFLLNESAERGKQRITNLSIGREDISFVENIKAVETYLEVEATGKYSNIQSFIDAEYAFIDLVSNNGIEKELIENSIENSRYYFLENEGTRTILKNNDKYWELTEVNLENRFVSKRIKGTSTISLFEDAINVKVQNNSDSEIEFIYINQTLLPDNKVRIQIGKREIIVTQEELNDFINGNAETFFGENSQFSESIVVLRPTFAFNSTYNLNGFNKNSNRFFKNINKHVYFSSCFTRAKENLRKLPKIGKAEDVGICVSDNFQIKDYGVIKKAEKNLNKNNVESVSVGENSKSNILIITGHRDAEFKNYLNSLASSNTVKGKYVVLFSCYEDGIQAFNTNLISQGNAKAILFFPDKLHPNAVQAVLKEFNKIIEEGQLNRKVDEILQESIDKALKKVPGPLKNEVLKMKDAQIQLTFNHIFLQLFENVA